MLKWAVNTPRLSYLPNTDTNANQKTLDCLPTNKLNALTETPAIEACTPSGRRQRLKRKSSDFYLSRRLQNWLEKENQLEERITSTPLQQNSSTFARSCPLRRLNSLKDLSNIIPSESASAAGNDTTPKPISSTLNTRFSIPGSCGVTRNNPTNYAATLPTLEVEYSPCGLVPGPILALRGLGIADTYFDKPRYLPPEATPIRPKSQTAPNTGNSAIRQNPQSACPTLVHSVRDDTVSLSSSRMGDQTLERMIDAILESTRKEKRHIKFARQFHHQQRSVAVMSPTYTKAEDPANDLSEFWCDNERNEVPLPQSNCKKRRSLPAKIISTELAFSEREVRSPIATKNRLRRLQDTNFLHLRRHRAVRRKRRISKSNRTCTKECAQDATAVNVETPALEIPVLTASKALEDASPDSGHNSCSELEDNSVTNDDYQPTTEHPLENGESRALDATKRRLHFSNETITASPSGFRD